MREVKKKAGGNTDVYPGIFVGFMDGEPEDLIRQIEERKVYQEEYKLIKVQCQKLAELEDVNKFFKEPDDTVGEFKYELPDKLSVDAMINALSNLMQKMTVKAEVVQEKKVEKK